MRMIAWAVILLLVVVVAYFVIPWAIMMMGRLRDPRDKGPFDDGAAQ
jgi:hypothetical protein